MSRVVIIAEAGVNHNGSIELAKKLVDVAADAGVDYVKFQTFKAEKIASSKAKKAEYQDRNTDGDDSQLKMLQKLELSESDHGVLLEYCHKKNIQFLSTPFDLESIDLLKSLNITLGKIPSGEITNFPYLKKMGKSFSHLVMSTGMSDMKEIEDAVKAIEDAGFDRKNLTMLHCNSEYPTPFEDVNLRAMNTIAEKFDVPIGYSDHTTGIEIPVAAVALGAVLIEKHFTLDRNMDGPDHKASLEPAELKEMVRSIRNVELSLGNGIKEPSPSEIKNRSIARKSIVAAKDLSAGHTIEYDDLSVKRPGTGISPMQIDLITGKKLLKDIKQDEVLTSSHVEI